MSALDHTTSLSMSSMVHISPTKWIKVNKWAWVLSGLARVEANLSCPSSAEWGQHVYSASFIFKNNHLFWLQTNPSPGCFSGWTLSSLFSWSVGLWGEAYKMETVVWDCQSCCKCDPFRIKHLQPSVMLWHMASLPARSFGPNPSITLLREKMGKKAIVKDWDSSAGINSNSSKLKLRNVTCKPESYKKLPGTSKSFLFLLLLRFYPWEIYF